MKQLKVIELGNPTLRVKAKEVSLKELGSKEFKKFAKDLVFACDKKNGMGIAAPQVGVSKRVFVVWSSPNKRYKKAPKMEPLVVVNPKITKFSKAEKKDFEGCLSIPGIRGLVKRSKEIEIEFLNIEGEKRKEKFNDFVARIFQHEYDHLNGIVFLDRSDPKDLLTEKEYKKIINKRK